MQEIYKMILFCKDSIDYFSYVVEQMKEGLSNGWEAPPLIVEYVYGHFQVDDGRHRLELFRQLGVERVWAVIWTTGEENRKTVEEILANTD